MWTVRGFDEAYTAPHHGFRDADDYYFRASALRVIDKVRVPALIIASDNDPFVPAEQFRRARGRGQSARHRGDHARRRSLRLRREAPAGYDGYWAEQRAIAFVAARRCGGQRRVGSAPSGARGASMPSSFSSAAELRALSLHPRA